MKPKTRNILIVVAVVLAVVAGIVVYGMYRVYSFLSDVGLNREVPTELKETRVTKGADFLERTEFFKLPKEGFLKTVSDSSAIRDEKERERAIQAGVAKGVYNFSDLQFIGDRVIAVGQFGGYEFDLQGGLKRNITFEPTTERIKIGPLESDRYETNFDNLRIIRLDGERLGYISVGTLQGVRVFDDEGRVIWENGKKTLDLGSLVNDQSDEYDKSSHVLEAAVGDLNGDGVSEYVIATKNDGIRALDNSGRELWATSDDFPHRKLAIVDLDEDGANEVVEIGKAVRDGRTGVAIRDMSGTNGDTVLFSPRKDKGFDVNFADISEGKLSYSSEGGKTIFTAEAPLSTIPKPPKRVEIPGDPEISYVDDSDNVAFPKAVLVRFRKNEPPHLAVIAAFIGLPRANFYVYDHQGSLVYHELLPEEAETIAVIPAPDGLEQVLVGGKDTIWKYTAR